MPRSRTGCLTCRSRKLKCDEQRPICAQCTKAHRDCRYGEGIVFRHQQNASMNGPEGESAAVGNSLRRFYSYKNTFDEHSIWVDIPKQVTFVDNSDPYHQDLNDVPLPSHDATLDHDNPTWNLDGVYQSATSDIPTHGLPIAANGLDALSAAASQDQWGPPTTESSIARSAITYAQNQRSPPSKATPARRRFKQKASMSTEPETSPNEPLGYIPNSANDTSPPIDPNLNSSINSQDAFLDPALSAQATDQDTKAQNPAERDQQVAFLLRRFSENQGQS